MELQLWFDKLFCRSPQGKYIGSIYTALVGGRSLTPMKCDIVSSILCCISRENDGSGTPRCYPNPEEHESVNFQSMEDTSVVLTQETVVNFETAVKTDTTDVVSDVRTPSMLTLGSFLERPVTIADSTVSVGAALSLSLDIWDLWSKDVQIRAKLRNYAYFKASLNIRFSVTATPFNYGQIILAYLPYARFNDTWNAIAAKYALFPAELQNNIVSYLSQGPFTQIVDITEESVYEMKIPYINMQNYMRIRSDSPTAYANAASFTDFLAAGQLVVIGINPISSASSDYLTPVSYNILAWATEVEVHTPTSTYMNVSAQSRSRKYKVTNGRVDEYTDPPTVSSVASNVGAAAKAIGKIPMLKPFTTPVEIAADMIGGLASMFGFSKPAQLEAAIYNKGVIYDNTATTLGSSTAQVLALDHKNALVYNGSAAGSTGEDEMSFEYLCQKETFLSQCSWSTTSTPYSTKLFYSAVTPNLACQASNGIDVTVTPAPCAWVAKCFRYWRGTIRFRFRVVSSKFQRGKFLITFEPNGQQTVFCLTQDAILAAQTSVIVDIQNTKDVTLDVEWNCPTQWLENNNTLANDSRTAAGNVISGTIMTDSNESLGYIRVVPLTALVSSSAAAPVYINVFASMLDAQFAVPTQEFVQATDFTLVAAQSQMTKVDMSGESNLSTGKWFGESIVSFRTLMKRYNKYGYFGQADTTNASNTLGIPYPPSSHITPYSTVLDTNRLSDLYTFLRFCYMGVAGGQRYHLRLANNPTATTGDVVGYNALVTVNRVHVSAPYTTTSNTGAADADDVVDINGALIFDKTTNGGVDFEMPLYNANQYLLSFCATYGGYESGSVVTTVGDGLYMHRVSEGFTVNVRQKVTGKRSMWVDSSISEDFNFYLFCGCPSYVASS